MRAVRLLLSHVLTLAILTALPTRRVLSAAEPVRRDPKIQRAIDRGADYLKANGFAVMSGWESFPALAMLKAGVPATDPMIVKAIDKVRSKIKGDVYEPIDKAKHIYEAGVDLMLLSDAAPGLYQKEIELIVSYVVAKQFPDGRWDYPINGAPPQIADVGDTSISQYALLGLWAADRAGVDVPLEAWDKAAQWHLRTQRPDGSFSYHPGGKVDTGPTHSMTAGGTGSLMIARMHLSKAGKNQKPAESASAPRLGFLEKVDLDADAKDHVSVASNSNYNPKVSDGALEAAAAKGARWIADRFTVDKPTGEWGLYYLYGLERMAALADLEQIGGHDWYNEGAEYLVRTQLQSGTWQGKAPASIATSFAILFLTESTGSILNRRRGVIKIGAGLLAGGRGLPDNLAQVQVEDGKVKERKFIGPLDEMLAALEKPKSLQVSEAQAALVESVQIGDREALVGQTDRLIKLLGDPRPDVRRTAAWALGRTDNLRTAAYLIDALKDPDVDVMVEARNALCALSRKTRGFGLPESPTAGLPEDASDQQQSEAIKAWRKQAIEKWQQWYFSVRPYDERDDIAIRKRD